MTKSRQAKSISKIRAKRQQSGLCRDCGAKSKTYRCKSCNASRREAARLLMQRRKT